MFGPASFRSYFEDFLPTKHGGGRWCVCCITYSISEKIYCFGFGDERDTWALILCCHRLQYICDKRLYLSLSDFNLRSPRSFCFFPFSRLSLALRYCARYLLIRGNVICGGVVWPSLPLSVVLLFSFVAYLSRPCARPFGSNQKAPGYVFSLHLPLFFAIFVCLLPSWLPYVRDHSPFLAIMAFFCIAQRHLLREDQRTIKTLKHVCWGC